MHMADFGTSKISAILSKSLNLGESELFIFAGYLSPQPSNAVESFSSKRLDPYVANVLSQEPLEVQRTVFVILYILKSMTKGTAQQNSRDRTKRLT